MNRRAVAWIVHILSVSIVAVTLVGGLGTVTSAAGANALMPASVPVDSTIPPEPPTTANEFFPENADVTDCLGTVERPGCGSKSRGGWRQTLVFIAMIVGLIVIFGRVAYGVSRNRNKLDPGSTLPK